MLIKFYEHSLNQIRTKMSEHTALIAKGQAHTFDYYRFLCGKLQGLTEAEAILKDLFDRMQNTKAPLGEKHAELY